MNWKHSYQSFVSPPVILGAALILTGGPCPAQTVEKVADLNFVSVDGVGLGGYAPLAMFAQVGTDLWFTTDRGGTFDAGTISRFDLVTREVIEVASLDNLTGRGSESALLVIEGEGYFTTKRGGTGDAGTIARVNLETGVIGVVFDFPENNAASREAGTQVGATPRASLTRIGDELWTTTSLGGNANRGTIVRYSLLDGVTRLVTHLDGPLLGGQAFGGLTAVGTDAWYFTTFTGGSTFGQEGLPLGAGTLGRITFDESGDPVIERMADMTPGHEQFPGLEPTLVGTHSLYFGTTGPNRTPGAIIRYDLESGTWTNLFSFTTNAVESLNYGERPGYSGPVEWQNHLYFLTRGGGAHGLGVVAKFDLASNNVIKLADLDGTEEAALGRATGIFDNTGLIVEEHDRFFLYYTVTAGGVHNRGTILRVALPPPPLVASVAGVVGGELSLTWMGGYPPFTVEAGEGWGAEDWTTVASGLETRSITLPADGAARFFRVLGSH